MSPDSASQSRRLSDKELRAIYDQHYVDIYDPHAVRRISRMLPLFELSRDEKVIDVGCGNGVLAELISNHVRQYVGIDFSEPFVQAARRRVCARGIGNATFHSGDIVEFCDHHQREFDAAFALDFVEHIYDDQFLEIGRAVHRSLTPDGVWYIHTPNADYFMERLHHSSLIPQVEGHVAVRDAARYVVLLGQCGFENVRLIYRPHYLRLAGALHSLSVLPFVGRFARARLFLICRK
jgi:2-polyprenyl-3-methyl-5-hydroxy-6-metoxy-1,4-benzoquinol methylase